MSGIITYLIIGITVAVSFLCFSNPALFRKLALTPYDVVRDKEYYRLITHAFVHADSMHLLVNMFTLWSFGTYMEQLFARVGFGASGYLLLYFGGMLAASIPDVVRRHQDPFYSSIGASGAVSAVLFAAIFFDPWSSILLFAVIPIPGIVFGVLYLVYCQYMARRGGDNINHSAHFYGAVFGFLLPLVLRPSLFHFFLSHFGL